MLAHDEYKLAGLAYTEYIVGFLSNVGSGRLLDD